MIKIIVNTFKKHIYLFILLFFIIILGSFLGIIPIKIIQAIVDLAQKDATRNINQILKLGILYLVLHIAATFIKAISSYLSSFLQSNIGVQLQKELYKAH